MLLPIRLILLLINIVIFSIYGIILGLLRHGHPNNTWKVASKLGPTSFKILGIRLTVIDGEKSNFEDPCVMIANHQHNLDMLTASCAMKQNTVTIGKRSIAKIPFFGQFYALTGNILVERGNARKAYMALKEITRNITENAVSVWVFPEGTRSPDEKLLEFKKGAFISAIQAGVPILPVAISRFAGKINLNKWKSAEIMIKYLDPIQTKGLTTKDAQDLANKAQEIMQLEVDKIS